MSLRDPSMEDLPIEIMVDILSRLPVKTIIQCKCVCKKWRNIVLDPYFADLQLSRSPAGIMVHHYSKKETTVDYFIPGILKWVEVEDEIDHHHLHHDPVMSLDLNLAPIFQKFDTLMAGSVNGLICVWQYDPERDKTYICNPITREYMILPSPMKQQYRKEDCYTAVLYGFGVGLVTKDYKVIRICEGDIPPNHRPGILEAEVYTLGSGQWRTLGDLPYWLDGFNGPYGTFLNGHAHWTVVDKDSPEKICDFDFDKETFQLFPSPPCEAIDETRIFRSLGILKGCLCQCESYSYTLTLWVMKEYGIKKSWHKELVIETNISRNLDLLPVEDVYVIEGFKDGTILLESGIKTLLVYCPRTKTVVDTDLFDGCLNGLPYRPSFHRLHNFKNERVHVI